jgi:hypothetical protein
MKKIICVLLIAAMATIGFAGCCANNEKVKIGRFESLSYYDNTCGREVRYFRDTITDIIYIMNVDSYQGGICPLYNTDGTPMLYDEFMESIEEG